MDEITKAAAIIKKHCSEYKGSCIGENGTCQFHEKDNGCTLMNLFPESWPVNTEDAE